MRLTVQHTFPRILEANYKTDGTIFIVPLTSSINVGGNGIPGSANRIMMVPGGTACTIVEPQAILFAVLILNSSISNRDWSEPADHAHH